MAEQTEKLEVQIQGANDAYYCVQLTAEEIQEISSGKYI